ncbi:MAG: BatA domain-containing protein [Planctomycetes bacterium]|nr:BatA domain-containing protein [Planctomycetota bacterium]
MPAFQNPIFLLGLLAAGLPLIIHLIHRRRAKVVKFSSLRLLRLIDARLARRRRLREILLLVARTAALVLLPLALARPVADGPRSGAGGDAAGARAAVVVLLDDTMSLGYREEGATRFQRARAAAAEVLRTLEPGDEAMVLSLSRLPAPGGEFFTRDTAALALSLDESAPTLAAGDPRAAFERAGEALGRSTMVNREVYLISDMQERGGVDRLKARTAGGDRARARAVADLLPQGARVTFINVARGSSPNVAIEEVSLPVAPLVVGRETTIAVRLANHSGAAAEVTASLVVGGKAVRDAPPARVEAGATTTATIAHAFAEAGEFLCSVRVTGDALEADDERFFLARVSEQTPVLIVNGAPSPVPYQDASFYLAAALESDAPAGPAGARAPIYRLDKVHPSKMPEEGLAKYRAVLLLDVPGLAPSAALALRRWVSAGGGLVVFAGGQVDGEEYDKMFSAGGAPLTAARVAFTEGAGAGADAAKADADGAGGAEQPGISFEAPTAAHPALPAGLLGWTSPRLVRWLRLEPREGEPAREVLRFSNGYPAIVEKPVGRGVSLFCAFPADASWGNLPLRAVYLPLVRALARHAAASREGVLAASPGAPVPLAPGAEHECDVVIVHPGGREERRLVAPAGAGGGASGAKKGDESLAALTPWETGLYDLRVTPRGGRPSGEGAAGAERRSPLVVNVDTAAESAPAAEPRSAADLAEIIAADPRDVMLVTADELSGLRARILARRHGRDLWPWFFWAAIALLVGESIFANWLLPAKRVAARGGSAASAGRLPAQAPTGAARPAPVEAGAASRAAPAKAAAGAPAGAAAPGAKAAPAPRPPATTTRPAVGPPKSAGGGLKEAPR